MKIGSKVKEKIARIIGAHFSTAEIVNVFTEANIETDASLYAKWRITLDAFNKVKTEAVFFNLIEEFCHPLNFSEPQIRQNFINELNPILAFEDVFIEPSERSAEVLPLFLTTPFDPAESKPDEEDKYVELPDINAGSFSQKVIHLVCEEFLKHLSNYEVRKVIRPIIQKDDIMMHQVFVKSYLDDLFEETPFDTFEDVLQTIRRKDENADKTLATIITSLLHPLNYDADEDKAGEIADKLGKYLKYDNFYIQKIGNDFEIFSEAEMDYLHSPSPDWEERSEQEKQDDIKSIKQHKELVKSLREAHQVYMDVVDTFCQDSKNPTKELNDAYLFLTKKIEGMLKTLDLKQHKVFFYKPFKNDLYTAEIEWNGSGTSIEPRHTPKLSWDAIRPSLYRVHSNIISLNNIAEEDTDMTDDEKKLEEITNLISEKRTAKSVSSEKQKTFKMEITKMPDLNVNTLDNNALAKGKKAIHLPKFPSTEWSSVEIRFITENDVYIKAGQKTVTADFEGLGFRNDKTGKPNTAWHFLFELAKNNGQTSVIKSPIPDNIKQQKRNLSDRLRTIFKNDTDPFNDFSDDNTYRIKINLIPPVKEKAVNDIGVDEYLNETMISTHPLEE